jgi:hypothetical integral membrane protein (TIGR02206 family)
MVSLLASLSTGWPSASGALAAAEHSLTTARSAMPARGTFTVLSPEHIGALLALTLLTVITCTVLRRTAGETHAALVRCVVCVGIAVLSVGGAIFGQLYEVYRDNWTLQDSLPLQICSIGVYVVAATLLLSARPPRTGRQKRWNQRLFELSYFWGLGGTLQAILTPDVNEPFPSPTYFRYFITHGGIVVGTLVLMIGLGMRPRRGSWRWIWIATFCLAVFAYGVDLLLDANYMYLMGPPPNPSLLDFLGKGPWSPLQLAGVVALGTIVILVWYSPWWLADRIRTRRSLRDVDAVRLRNR